MAISFDTHRDLQYGSITSHGRTVPYRYFVPLDYDPSKKYPLLLFLHGAGERGNDNEAQLVHVVWQLFSKETNPAFQSIVIVPQCPVEEKWVDTNWSAGSYVESDKDLASPNLMAVLDVVDEFMGKYSVDLAHVYAMGISMGGYGTWWLLAHRSDLFAGGIPICGGGNPSLAKNMAPLAIHAFHSTDDGAVPVQASRDMVKAIIEAGGQRMRYTEYNFTGHGCWVNAADTPGLMEWLFSQTKA